VSAHERGATGAANASGLEALAGRIAQRTGWRRYSLAFLLGVSATLALPPFYATVLMLPAFTGLVWLLDGTVRPREAFFIGWSFGFGFFLSGLYWIGISMTVDLATFGWMIPFSTGGLSAYLALFPGAALLAVKLSRARGIGRIFALAAAWTIAEWLRGHLFTGFPWNLVAYTWTVGDAPLQFAAAVGSYGLSLVTVLIMALPAVLAGSHAARRKWIPLGATLALVAALWGGGALRLAGAGHATVPGVELRLVQPDIQQEAKWDRAHVRANLLEAIRLSTGPGYDKITDIIWPETSIGPFFLADEPELRATLAKIVPKGGLLLTGSLRREPGAAMPGAPPGVAAVRYFNSLEVLDARGQVIAAYDKHHLVPFGEYVPLRSVLGIVAIAEEIGDFAAGPGPRTLELPHLPPVGPLICYEAIFPGAVAADDPRPHWLLNITNDAWFGNSTGPYQHFESARMRAVEEGIPMVRDANTGISGIVDAYGRVRAILGLERPGVVDGPLPTALDRPTLYARYGDLGLVVMLVGCLGLAIKSSLR
jgi:apolipoprotein N-acyltransferase